jgi:hypothetical protein
LAQEKARREHLFEQAKAWRTARDIRSFVAEVLTSAPEHGEASMRAWADWALAEADALDPTRAGRLNLPNLGTVSQSFYLAVHCSHANSAVHGFKMVTVFDVINGSQNMTDEEGVYAVKQLIFEHVRSPSLRHIRDPYVINKLAYEIIRRLDRRNSTWRKWEGPRETLLRSAALCWIPIEDMRDYLNQMPGPALTTTDVVQRLRAFHEEDYASYPNEDLQPSCVVLYEEEKAQGTELPAIIGTLQEHVEREEQRLRSEREANWQKRAEEDRVALEQRFLSGADCKWTRIQKSKELYCRINGRSYRLSLTADKMWNLYRIASVEDRDGALIGKYRYRGDVTKALAQIAYQPEPKW